MIKTFLHPLMKILVLDSLSCEKALSLTFYGFPSIIKCIRSLNIKAKQGQSVKNILSYDRRWLSNMIMSRKRTATQPMKIVICKSIRRLLETVIKI